MSRKERRKFTEEFKLQMVQLYNNDKAPSEIVKEYDLTRSALMNWIQKYNKTGSFKESDNISEEEKELKKLKKKSLAIKNGKWYFKTSSADNGTKIEVI